MTALHWILWSLGLLACLALLAWALFWDRARGKLRCPRCWYDMSGAAGRRCPECGHEAHSGNHLLRTRRRWKPAIAALLLGLAIALGPFGKTLLVRGVDYLPDTALILLTGRITFDEPYHVYRFDSELTERLREGPNYCVSRWKRGAMWCWQWQLLAGREEPEMAQLSEVAAVFAPAPPARESLVVTHEEMTALDHDPTGTLFGALQKRLQLPRETFLPEHGLQL